MEYIIEIVKQVVPSLVSALSGDILKESHEELIENIYYNSVKKFHNKYGNLYGEENDTFLAQVKVVDYYLTSVLTGTYNGEVVVNIVEGCMCGNVDKEVVDDFYKMLIYDVNLSSDLTHLLTQSNQKMILNNLEINKSTLSDFMDAMVLKMDKLSAEIVKIQSCHQNNCHSHSVPPSEAYYSKGDKIITCKWCGGVVPVNSKLSRCPTCGVTITSNKNTYRVEGSNTEEVIDVVRNVMKELDLNKKHKNEVLVITEMELELKPIINLICFPYKITTNTDNGILTYRIHVSGELDILIMSLCGLNRMNKKSFIYMSLNNPNIKLIVLTGICSAFKKSLNYGDIIISDQFASYDISKKEISSNSKMNVIKSKSNLKSSMMNFRSNRWMKFSQNIFNDIRISEPTISIGSVLSVSEVLSSAKEIEDIEDVFNAPLTIDMSTYEIVDVVCGCNYSPPFIMVKSVSDFIDNIKTDIYKNYSATIAGSFVIEYVVNNYSKTV